MSAAMKECGDFAREKDGWGKRPPPLPTYQMTGMLQQTGSGFLDSGSSGGRVISSSVGTSVPNDLTRQLSGRSGRGSRSSTPNLNDGPREGEVRP
jgi:hypothetical protein